MKRLIGLEITTVIGCSNNCPYCPQKRLIKEYADAEKSMSFSSFKKCIETVPISHGIYFAGFAEPFLNHSCLDMITYANEKGHPLFLNTTLVGVTKEILAQLKQITFERFEVHVIPQTDPELLLFAFQTNSKIKYRHHIKLSERLQGIIPPKLLRFIPIHDRAQGKINKTFKLRYCLGYAWGRHVLLPNGDVVLCCMDYGLKHKLGNLLRDSYDDLKNSREMKQIIEGHKNSEIDILCRHCPVSREIK